MAAIRAPWLFSSAPLPHLERDEPQHHYPQSQSCGSIAWAQDEATQLSRVFDLEGASSIESSSEAHSSPSGGYNSEPCTPLIDSTSTEDHWASESFQSFQQDGHRKHASLDTASFSESIQVEPPTSLLPWDSSLFDRSIAWPTTSLTETATGERTDLAPAALLGLSITVPATCVATSSSLVESPSSPILASLPLMHRMCHDQRANQRRPSGPPPPRGPLRAPLTSSPFGFSPELGYKSSSASISSAFSSTSTTSSRPSTASSSGSERRKLSRPTAVRSTKLGATDVAATRRKKATCRTKAFACNACPRSFSRKHDLERHSRVHTGHTPYECDECDRSFRRSDALLRHKKAHEEGVVF